MKFSLGKKIVISFIVVTAAFATMLYAFYYSTQKVNSTTEGVKQSQETLRVNEQILSLTLEIGFGSREYLITGNEKLLQPFKQAVSDIRFNIIEIRALTGNNPAQQKRIDKLEALTKERIAFAENTIALRKANGIEAAFQQVNTGEGRRITDATRSLLNEINAEELQLLTELEKQGESSMGYFEKVLITLIVFVDVILILVGVMIFHNQNVREKYEEQLRESNSQLESFSYMVSHDLRAPVRTLLSLVSIVKKRYESEFVPELKVMFGHVQAKAQRMNSIIEDLLTLARYEREELKPAPADMNSLFSKAWDNISLSVSHKARLEMATLPVVVADVSMMEQVIVNLCSNAIKYSSRKEEPVVKVGYTQAHNETTFYVKDNGAGFNMQNYNRLFKAFQRLHHVSEFEGTGVGLLLVKKIIEMHRGKIWAESAPNEGATFYFTLPAKAA